MLLVYVGFLLCPHFHFQYYLYAFFLFSITLTSILVDYVFPSIKLLSCVVQIFHILN